MANEHNILIVEDEVLTAKDLRYCLESFGYDVLPQASSCSEAIVIASDYRPDLVLMDIHLQGPSDGIEAAQVIRDRLEIPIVFITAYADRETVNRAKRVGPSGYLLKPIRDEELRATLEVALHKRQPERKSRVSERVTQSIPCPAEATPSTYRGRVLIVDDDATVGRVIQRMVGTDQDTVLCNSVKQALETLKSGQEFDVILCDLMMPEATGMDLYELLSVSRPEYARRVVFLTGGGFTPRAADFLATTTAPTLHKPIDLESLRATIRAKFAERINRPRGA